MKQREIKPDTEYATCDGNLVVSASTDPTKTNWLVHEDGKTSITSVDPVTGTGDDPWGTCGSKQGGRRGRVVHGKGVRVTYYAYDADGNRTGKGEETVIPAKDIPGTWAEYMILHADRVRTTVLSYEADEEARRRSTETEAALTTALTPEATPPDEWLGNRAAINVFVNTIHTVDRKGKKNERLHTSRVYRDTDQIIETRYVTRLELTGEVADRVIALLIEEQQA